MNGAAVGFAIELPWKRHRAMTVKIWMRCALTVLPHVTHWYVDMIESERFLAILADPVRATVTAKYPQLLKGKGTLTGPVTPEEVQLFLDAWAAPSNGKEAWGLLNVLRCHLRHGNTLLFGSEEFCTLIEVHPPEVGQDASLLAEFAGMGLLPGAVDRL